LEEMVQFVDEFVRVCGRERPGRKTDFFGFIDY